MGRIAVDRDGRTHSGPRREQQQGRPGDRNAQGVTREQGTSGLGWGTELLQERKGKEIRPERCVETGYREMGKRLARESGPSDLAVESGHNPTLVLSSPHGMWDIYHLEVPLRDKSHHSPEGQCLMVTRGEAPRTSCVG